LGNLNANVGDIQGNLSLMATSDATMGGYLTNAQTARDNSQKIPNNALNNLTATIQYTTPFSATYSGASPTIDSVVVRVVGSGSNSSSISGSLYKISS
jgi:hypothetical protein